MSEFTITVDGVDLPTDAQGYLEDLTQWTPSVARTMAAADDCELSEEHWAILHIVRNYYTEYQIAPAMRVLTKAIGRELGADKANSRYLYSLYPRGPARQACRYAGLPKPTGCV